METINELKEEMFEDYLWDRWYDELFNQAVKEQEKKASLFKSVLGFGLKIDERHRELFEERLNQLRSKR